MFVLHIFLNHNAKASDSIFRWIVACALHVKSLAFFRRFLKDIIVVALVLRSLNKLNQWASDILKVNMMKI